MSLLSELLDSAEEFLKTSSDLHALFERFLKHLDSSKSEQKDIDRAILTLIGDFEDEDIKKEEGYYQLSYIPTLNFLCTLEGKYQPSNDALNAFLKAVLSENKNKNWCQFIFPFVREFYSQNYVNFILKYWVTAFTLEFFMPFYQKAAGLNHIEIVKKFCSFNDGEFVKGYKKDIFVNVPVSSKMFEMLTDENDMHPLGSHDIDDVLLNLINKQSLPLFFLETISFLCGLKGENKPTTATLLKILHWAANLMIWNEGKNVQLQKITSTINDELERRDDAHSPLLCPKRNSFIPLKKGIPFEAVH